MSNSQSYDIGKSGGTVNTNGMSKEQKQQTDADVARGQKDSGRR